MSYRKSKIVLKGWHKNVQNLQEKLQALLEDLKVAVDVSERVSWKWTESSTGAKELLPLRVALKIETAFQQVLLLTIYKENEEINYAIKVVKSVKNQSFFSWRDSIWYLFLTAAPFRIK